MSSSARLAAPGWGWLIGVSSWLVAVFIGPATAWIGFFIVGAVSRRRAAYIAGAASGILGFTVATEVWGGFSDLVGAIVHLGGIIVGLALNPGWLRTLWERRVAAADKRGSSRTASTSQAARATTAAPKRRRRGSRAKPASQPAATSAAEPEARRMAETVGASSSDLLQTAEPVETVDVQTATADELADLPGLNRTKARRAVKVRTKNGGFFSVEDFGEAAGLQPHEIVRLRSAATCSPRPRSPRSFGRRVDL
ncbi:ComEA family DNA-binding protein [Microbacterium oleivorans]|uniref:ComEA protein n=1 Tax=Microbacterium oleivorans TaxID=273677 RepID=A0A031FS18_9MICO|nr:helix-hairpin-helix domain-containing protein [Microbacterium oleivorans]EZP27624.1 comEA protein [Microbacterium oleivorans]